MADCIDRERAMAIVVMSTSKAEAEKGLRDLAAENVVPVQLGKWVVERICNFPALYRYECSECGMENDGEDNFCPNCGADMRKDGEHDRR